MIKSRGSAYLFIAICTTMIILTGCKISSTSNPQPRTGYIQFNNSNWTYYSYQNEGYPAGDSDTLTLTPDNRDNAGGAAWYVQDVAPAFTAEFEMSILDDDGGPFRNSAYGISFMFCKDKSNYGDPPIYRDLGFKKDNTGYGIMFRTYTERSISIINGKGELLQSIQEPEVYTNGEWKKVKVVVYSNQIQVYFNEVLKLTWTGTVDATYKGLGFGASTWVADSEHKVRNFTITNAQPPTGELTTIKTINCTQNKELLLVMDLTNIESLSNRTLELTYNPQEMDPIDLCAQTWDSELTTGAIAGTNISVSQYDSVNGKIVFSVDRNDIDVGKVWSGVVNTVKFKAKVTKACNITYKLK